MRRSLKDNSDIDTLEAKIGCLVGVRIAVFMIVIFSLLLFILITFQSCATTERIIYKDKEIVKHRIDSFTIYQRDSVYFNTYIRGDTVFQDRYKEKIKYLDKIVLKTDTLKTTDIQKTIEYREIIPYWVWWLSGISVLIIVIFLVTLYIKIRFK